MHLIEKKKVKVKRNIFQLINNFLIKRIFLTLSARSGTTVPHQVASKAMALTSRRLLLSNQIGFPNHVGGQAMLIGPQEQTRYKSGCSSIADNCRTRTL